MTYPNAGNLVLRGWEHVTRSLLFVLGLIAAPVLYAADEVPGSPAWDIAHSWEGTLPLLRAGALHPPAYALYIGRAKSVLWQRIRQGQVDTSGVWIFRLSANDEVTNPFTDRKTTGIKAIANLLGPVNDLSGGSMVFFDADFAMIPRFTIVQNFHRGRPEVISFYCAMIADPLRDKLTMAEFARYKAMPIGLQLTMEVEGGRHRDFAHLFREIPADEPLFRGLDASGQVVDPRTNPAIHVVTADPSGEVFIAVMRELWEKLAIGNGTQKQRPPLVVFGPARATYPALDVLGIGYTAVALTEQQLQGQASPRIILPQQQVPSGEKGRGAIEITGFIPGQVVGQYVLSSQAAGLLNDFRLMHPDIPFGDVDVERTLPPVPGPTAAAQRVAGAGEHP